jgi:hypothetical protein
MPTTPDNPDVVIAVMIILAMSFGLIIPKMLIDFISDRWTQAKSKEAEKYANDR